MKPISIQEKVGLLEKGINLLGEEVDAVKRLRVEIEDIKTEIKALKIFFGRAYPDFKRQYPEIVKKL